VVGVAAGIPLYSLKILDADGAGEQQQQQQQQQQRQQEPNSVVLAAEALPCLPVTTVAASFQYSCVVSSKHAQIDVQQPRSTASDHSLPAHLANMLCGAAVCRFSVCCYGRHQLGESHVLLLLPALCSRHAIHKPGGWHIACSGCFQKARAG
jgi:hypothetical protein